MDPRAVLALIYEIGEAVIELAKEKLTPAEIRKRLADGIQRGDVISDDALEKVRDAGDRLDDYRRS